MTEDEVFDFGFMLEEKGLSHSEIDDILEHHGVKGQRWGVLRGKDGVRPIARSLNNSRFGKNSQNRVDQFNKGASKSGQSEHDRFVAKANVRRSVASGVVGLGATFIATKYLGKSVPLPFAAIAGLAAGSATQHGVFSFLKKDFNRTLSSIK